MAIFKALHVLGFFSLLRGAAAWGQSGASSGVAPQPPPRQRGQVVLEDKQMKKTPKHQFPPSLEVWKTLTCWGDGGKLNTLQVVG